MLDRVIAFSLRNRMLILVGAALVVAYGGFILRGMGVDVFPDLNRPTVTILTEAGGLSPEEVETQVSLPIEVAMNGAPGVERVRSQSGVGLSVVYVEFAWGTDLLVDRQLVQERLALARERLPAGVAPAMGPISSIMGEILLIGMRSEDGAVSPMEVRSVADWVVRQRLLTIPGIAQVINIGGGVKQFQVLVDTERLKQLDVSFQAVEEAAARATVNTTGGFVESGSQEFLVRNLARTVSVEELGSTVVAYRERSPISLSQVARIVEAPGVKRGDAGVNGKPAVILSVQKQPGANTLALTQEVEAALEQLRPTLPPGVTITPLFRQASFISAAISNVQHALRDGAILVVIVLLLFLLNLRTTLITLTAIPLSLMVTVIVFHAFGLSINTMTLGGLAVAIGELVDDAIVDVENVFRRLRENRAAGSPVPPLRVVYDASREVRNSIVFATILVVLVFVPLFSVWD
mgnify:CR=1 FL=1